MSLLNRLRPKWQNSDAEVRIEAVRDLEKSESELLAAVAQQDPDPRVRRVAVRKLDTPRTLIEIAESDSDEGVRNAAKKRSKQLLVQIACDSRDAQESGRALELLSDTEDIVAVAAKAHYEDLRRKAFEALSDDQALVELLQKTKDPSQRELALERIQDPDSLKPLIVDAEAADVALSALGRLDSVPSLEWVVAHGSASKAIRRAATTKLWNIVDEDHPLKTEKRSAEFLDLAEKGEALTQASSPDEDVLLKNLVDEWAKTESRGAPSAELAARFNAAVTAIRARHEKQPAIEDDLADTSAPETLPPEEPKPEPTDTDRKETPVEASGGDDPPAPSADEPAQDDGARQREADKIVDEISAVVLGTDTDAVSRSFARLARRWQHLESSATLEAKTRYASAENKLRELKEKTRLEGEAREQATLDSIQGVLSRMRELISAAEPSIKHADKELRAAQDLLKNMGPLARSINRKKVRRDLSQAREELFKKTQQLKDVEAWKRWANADIQNGLIVRVEALRESKDVPKIAKELRDIQAEWKRAGAAPADKSEQLWSRYKAARDELKKRCDAFFEQQDKDRKANLVKKQALCEQVEALADSSDWNQTAEKIKALQAEWKKIGAVPKKDSDALWKRFRGGCDAFFDRRKEHFGELKGERDDNLKQKRALCEQAEAIQNSLDWRDTAATLKKLQSDWRTVGPVPRRISDQLWKRFRKACDNFFDRYKRRDEVEAEAKGDKRRAMVEQAAELDKAGPEQEDLLSKATTLWTSWKSLGPLPGSDIELQQTFDGHLATLVSGAPDVFKNSELDPAESRKKRERLVGRLESLVRDLTPEAPEESGIDELEALAQKLKDALASNTMTGGKTSSGQDDLRRASDEVKRLNQNWLRAAPVPGDEGRALGQRYQSAYREFLAHKADAARR